MTKHNTDREYIRLLSVSSDSKTVKGEKYGVLTAILYLMAEKGAGGYSMCPWATDECTKLCLGKTAGMLAMPAQQKAQYKRTRFLIEDQKGFLEQLDGEIAQFVAKAKRKGMTPAIRLNGASDVLWERFGLIQKYSDVQFYDYTKAPVNVRQLPSNYHLTYSYSGEAISAVRSFQWQQKGVNTAVVFRGGLPDTFLGRKVIDGDQSDLRFADESNIIVGLKAKGKARKGVSTFVVEVDTQTKEENN